MKIKSNIPGALLTAAVSILQEYAPNLSPHNLVDSLQRYQEQEPGKLEKPMTRQEAAELLGVSMPTINRLLNSGELKRIKIARNVVRVDRGSVAALLTRGTAQ